MLWVAGVTLALMALRMGLDASWWILALIALATLPALWDLVKNPLAELHLTDQDIRWTAGQRSGQIPLARIANVRLTTQWDFSIRTSFHLKDGNAVHLPPDCQPPATAFETALSDAKLTVERQHFSRL